MDRYYCVVESFLAAQYFNCFHLASTRCPTDRVVKSTLSRLIQCCAKMDPITAIGLLASLSSPIKASDSVLGMIKSFKDGDIEHLDFFNDVSIFEEALKGFDRVLRSRQTRHNIHGCVINRALEEGLTTIRDLEKRLLQISKSEVSAVSRMKWVQNKSGFKKLHERLKEQSTMLQSFLTLAHAFVAIYSRRGGS